ncbi:MAG: glutathione reductase (NADPH), partial [Oleiphilaceae bacterium]
AHHFYSEHKLATLDYSNIPTAVFCQPTIGTVGLSEEQAKSQYDDVDVFVSNFKPMKHTLSGSDERCLMKMIVDKKTDKVLGIHMVGAEAGEIIQGMAVALKAGASKKVFDATIGIHPTAAEEFVTMRQPKSN